MLCICLAINGMCSQISTSRVVEIGLKGPPVAAPGFRSQISIVDGPPPIQSRMADLPFFFSCCSLALSVVVKVATPARDVRNSLLFILKPKVEEQPTEWGGINRHGLWLNNDGRSVIVMMNHWRIYPVLIWINVWPTDYYASMSIVMTGSNLGLLRPLPILFSKTRRSLRLWPCKIPRDALYSRRFNNFTLRLLCFSRQRYKKQT